MNIGMNAAIAGLRTAQRALDIAGHNVANANTEGYSRQRVDLGTTLPMGNTSLYMSWGGVGQVGTGVTVAVTPWRERHPILTAPGVLWRVWRQRRTMQ